MGLAVLLDSCAFLLYSEIIITFLLFSNKKQKGSLPVDNLPFVYFFMLSLEEQIFSQIKKAKNILLALPAEKNGDIIASALALFIFLGKVGKPAEIIKSNYQPLKRLAFLPQINQVKSEANYLQKFIISLRLGGAQVEAIKYQTENDKLNFIIVPKSGFFTPQDITAYTGGFKHDLIITVGASDLESLGSLSEQNSEFFYQTPIINIGHEADAEEFGQINYIKLKAAANAEVVYNLLAHYEPNIIDQDIATCLLTGLYLKTKSFKTANITPQTLATAAKLIELGAANEEITYHLYRSQDLSALKLWGRILARLSGTADSILAWSFLSRADFAKTQTKESDLPSGLEELMANLPQAKAAVLFYEPPEPADNSQSKALVSTRQNFDAQVLLKDFLPQGNKHLALITSAQPIQEFSQKVIANLKQQLKKFT